MAVPEAVKPLLDGLVALVRDRFGKRLTSVFLHGSLAHGGFSTRLSDVDACVVLADPLEEGDGPALVAITGELAERFPRFGPRLSLFWATESILKGESSGGRLGAVDLADLAQNGELLWGSDVRSVIRQSAREQLMAAMHADMMDRWKRRVTPFAGREALEAGHGAELDERTLLKICLYPARFLFTAETGRVVGNDEAAEHFASRAGEPLAGAVRLACEIRNRTQGPEIGSGASEEEIGRLAASFQPLVARFFTELTQRFGLEAPRA